VQEGIAEASNNLSNSHDSAGQALQQQQQQQQQHLTTIL
jgi:hypothetical protein